MFKRLASCSYSTFKSKNDQQLNQALVGRMKKLVVKGEKKVTSPNEISAPVDNLSETRTLSIHKFSSLVRLYTQDSILWNCRNLSRTYKVSEGYCENLVKYVAPVLHYTAKVDDQRILSKAAVHINVEKLKNDKTYYTDYQNVVFPDVKLDRLNQLASSELPRSK